MTNKIYLISTKELKQNMDFIYAFTTILSTLPGVKVRVIDLLDIFTRPILDIKLFNEDLDVVFAAFEKDAKERTEMQDYGVNIVLGAGNFKRKLSKAGVEIFQSLFSLIPGSKKSIYILVDNYEKLRTLKLESWYNQIDTSSGLWLGPGLNSQCMFLIDSIKEEDRKYNFEGLAFNMEDGKYTLIKTMMDGDE